MLAFFEKVTGLRMNHNYIRPGGVAADLPDGWRDDVAALCEAIPAPHGRVRQPAHRPAHPPEPSAGGRPAVDATTAIGLGLTGPLLRSTGVAWDLRRDQPYLAYDDVDFDVIVGTYGDCWDRYAIRFNEIRESIRIVRQIVDRMPAGDYRTQDKKVTPPPRSRIDESMEALIHHFKLYTEGFRVPAGRDLRRRSRAPAASAAATSCPTAPPSPTGCTCDRQLRQPAGAWRRWLAAR